MMVAAVDGANEASIRFYNKVGFIEVARMPEIGAKFSRWLDLVLLQLQLDHRSDLVWAQHQGVTTPDQ